MQYERGDAEHPGRWIIDTPSMDDFESLVFAAGRRQWYNIVVVGTPARISPEWIAKHPGYNGDNYEYASSYSIWHEDIGLMLDETDNPKDAFNYYLELTGKEWISIDRLELVDRRDPWENAG
jgi:hypothetical protein